MSCFNGELFLQEQLASIRDQAGPRVSLLARDDGSTDATAHLLERFRQENRGMDVVIVRGRNIGAARSFLAALDQAGNSDYYAFADQDDVWQPDKIARAVDRLAATGAGEEPALYYSNVSYTDARLRPRGQSDFRGPQTLEQVLFENRAVGCTIVFNHAARLLLLQSWDPERHRSPALMHDWWANLVVTAFGRTVFDEAAPVLYRQHAGNEIGGTASALGTTLGKTKFFIRNGIGGYRPSQQVQGLLDIYRDRLTPAQRQLLSQFLAGKDAFAERVRFALGPHIRRETWFDRLIVRTLVLLDKY
jgi:glycosyltransferase involved in cell wall biosynthesis